jgi:Anti-sigma-D factor RsdA to sigma factor binding region
VPGWDEYPHAGYPNGDPYEKPADLAALQADDALLDLIGSGRYIPSESDDELTRVLAAWRREVHAEPTRELVDTRTAMSVIRAAARRPAHRRHPMYGSVAAAAAVLVIAFSGVGLVAKSAQPGDHLWGVTQVLYSDYARSVETAAAVRTELNEAKVALNQGHPERARAALAHVQQQLPAIGESEGLTDLTARHRQLEQKLNEPPETQPAPPSSVPVPGSSLPSSATTDPIKSANPSQSPSSTSTTTTPSTTTEMPDGSSTTQSDQFMPNRDRYRHYRPGAGMPGSGSPDRSGSLDNGRSSPASPGMPGPGDTSNGDTTTGPRQGVDSSTPSPPADPGTPNPPTDHVGDPRSHGGFSQFCDHAVPRPRFCG